MASATPIPPPPGAPSTPAASPAPPQESPQAQAGSTMMIQLVAAVRAIAKAFPQTAPEMSKINDLIAQAQAKIMQSSIPGEPQAGPM